MRTATPARPRPRPVIRRAPTRSSAPKKRARRTAAIGTPAISSPAVELDRCRSASVRVHQGPMISITAKASIGFHRRRTVPRRSPLRRAKGSRRAAPSAHRANTTPDGDTSSTATLIIR
ncbi:hypothetical protein OG208_26020 [Streptomyces anthocyanicus]|nr:hypothetical protein [Streptomyces lividans]